MLDGERGCERTLLEDIDARAMDPSYVLPLLSLLSPPSSWDVDTSAGGSANGLSVDAGRGAGDGANARWVAHVRGGSSGIRVALGGFFSSVEFGSANGSAAAQAAFLMVAIGGSSVTSLNCAAAGLFLMLVPAQMARSSMQPGRHNKPSAGYDGTRNRRVSG